MTSLDSCRRSATIDQNQVFNRLPLNQKQKQKLYEELMEEYAKGNPHVLMDPVNNTWAQREGDLKVELNLEEEYRQWDANAEHRPKKTVRSI